MSLNRDNSKLAMASADISGFDPRKGRGGAAAEGV
jgi:hypothetical protein